MVQSKSVLATPQRRRLWKLMNAEDRQRLSLDLDPFSDEAIRDPIPGERALRDAAPAVWLPTLELWAIARYQDVRAALRDNEALISGCGVAFNSAANENAQPGTLTSDGALHRRLRDVLMKPMMPRALASVKPTVDQLASKLVDDLLDRESFDGIADFARCLPVNVVSHLVGLPEEGRERMLEWAQAIFNLLGPLNERALQSAPRAFEIAEYALNLDPAKLVPEGWAAYLFEAGEQGKVEPEEVRRLVIDYVAPSLDTTILATGHLLYLLGTHPEEYARVRAEPQLVRSAVNEALRLGSPVRGFTRLATRDYQVGEITIPEGDRVALFFGAANRDERHYTDPLRFDVTREARDHLAYGHGAHRCAGAHLAQLELECLLSAVVARVERIEVGEPRPLMSNGLYGHEGFDVAFH